MERLLNRYLGAGLAGPRTTTPRSGKLVDAIPDEELWRVHHWLKIKLIDRIRERARQRWGEERADAPLCWRAGTAGPHRPDPGVCPRFATYKRADLIFHDLERLEKSSTTPGGRCRSSLPARPTPPTTRGSGFCSGSSISPGTSLGGRIAFVEDYGEQMAQYLVHGVDVWLNNPLPPWRPAAPAA